MCDGRSPGFRNGSQEGRIIVEKGVVFLGRFLSSEEAGSSRVALRESMALRRDVLTPGLSSLGSLATMTLAGCIWRV